MHPSYKYLENNNARNDSQDSSFSKDFISIQKNSSNDLMFDKITPKNSSQYHELIHDNKTKREVCSTTQKNYIVDDTISPILKAGKKRSESSEDISKYRACIDHHHVKNNTQWEESGSVGGLLMLSIYYNIWVHIS